MKDKTGLLPSGLNSAQLKLWAIVAMTLDHVAWAFLPSASVPAVLMHLVGRTTAPIMCFFIAEGYYHTSNLRSYMARLGVFAVISHAAFQYYSYGPPGGPDRFPGSFLYTSVIYTLLLGLIALAVWNKDWPEDIRLLLIIALCLLAIPGDWMFIAIVYVLIFGRRDWDRARQYRIFAAFSAGTSLVIVLLSFPGGYDAERFWSSIVQFGALLAIPLLKTYNSERGSMPGGKWLFYIYYPLHLVVLGLLKWQPYA